MPSRPPSICTMAAALAKADFGSARRNTAQPSLSIAWGSRIMSRSPWGKLVSGGRQFRREQVNQEIVIDGHAAQPFRELKDHESRRDRRRVNRRPRRAGAGIGLFFAEERSYVPVVPARLINRQHAQD